MSVYASERYAPYFASCNSSRLKFDGNFLIFTGNNGREYKYSAVSGKQPSDYSLESQRASGKGPIPAGKYWIRLDELWERTFFKEVQLRFMYSSDALQRHRNGWGNYRISIHPYPETETYKRGGFFIHGGKYPGSAGCIDLTNEMDKFIDDLKSESDLSKCYIQLEVIYRD